MTYNPKIHHRRSIRLKGYDYSQAGAYFITICCQDRECRFGKIENDEMILNEYGNIAYNEWAKLPERFMNFELDVFQIMPNHMHGIIVLNDAIGAGFTPAQNRIDNTNAETEIVSNNQQMPPNQMEQPQIGQPLGLPLRITGDGKRAGASPALRLVILLAHTNHWWQMHVWKFIKPKMKRWGNCGNAITMNISSATNNRIKPFPITS